MSNIIKEFTRKDIIDAVSFLDNHPEEFKGRGSSTYDLVYEGKFYPPILVLSKANQLNGGSELLLSDFNNSTDRAFKYLTDKGFEIKNKLDIKIDIAEFIRVARDQITGIGTNSNAASFKRNNVGKYKDLDVELSYGVGRATATPWIAFLGENQKVKEGIYPVLLYYKSYNLLILAYGISESNPPKIRWDNEESKHAIKDYFNEVYKEKLKSYGDSFVFKVYDAENLPNDSLLYSDLDLLITEYKEVLANNKNSNISMVDKVAVRKDFNAAVFKNSISNANLHFNENLIIRFITSLITKPFVILTGLSGSGKTKLAQSFIQWICESEDQYNIVPVGADWINREPLLGYPNGLKDEEYVTPDNGVLQLMMAAVKEENQGKPFFLVLDEMNLSHVERYFADFLSVMESKDSIKLYTGKKRNSTDIKDIPKTISWPKNLFILGTVNIDETTYMFSPKVLDRANVIEFRLDETDLLNFLSHPKKVELDQLIGLGASMAASFLEMAENNEMESNQDLNDTLFDFFVELKKIGAEFGYRTAFEIHLLYSKFAIIDPTLSTDEKIDFAIMQKLLPKLHGSRSKIVKPLEALMKLCLVDLSDFDFAKLDRIQEDNIKYKVSFNKLKRMHVNAVNNGFTSYAEA